MALLSQEIEKIKEWKGSRLSGRVTHIIGLLIESEGPETYIDELCIIYGKRGSKVLCQVVGFKESKVLLMSLGQLTDIGPGCEVYPTHELPQIPVGECLKGRVLNAFGQPIDGKGELEPSAHYPVTASPPAPLSRKPISEVLATGVSAIDALVTLGKGQRIGIVAGPGVGKSTLMGMIAKGASADVIVIGLIGERGREVREFIEKELTPESRARAVVVVATSDQPAPLRIRGANVATAIAEFFRDSGQDVLLIIDSISRFAMAQREMGLAVGEPPTIRGYPPSLFAALPRLFERAGTSPKGSITGIYTILTEGGETIDPIAEQMRSLLDGHLLLSQQLASSGHFPPIDVLGSISRTMRSLATPHHLAQAAEVRQLLATYREAEDLLSIGAYVKGSNPKIDRACAAREGLRRFLNQTPDERIPFTQTLEDLDETLSSRNAS